MIISLDMYGDGPRWLVDALEGCTYVGTYRGHDDGG